MKIIKIVAWFYLLCIPATTISLRGFWKLEPKLFKFSVIVNLFSYFVVNLFSYFVDRARNLR